MPNESASLVANIALFSRFSASMMALAGELPERITLAQVTFFLLAGQADLAGNAKTFTEIKEAAGDNLSRSMHTTYKVFIAGGRQRDRENGGGLDWLYPEVDMRDNRKKYLHLTDEGRRVMRLLLTSMTKK